MIQSDFPTRQPAPKIGENGTWLEWDELTQAYVDTGRPSRGDSAGLSDDIKTALLTLAQKAAYVDEHGQDYYDALYAALYPPAELLTITASFAQGSHVVYDTDTLESLKPYLTVTGIYDDGSSRAITNYTLSGTLAEGTSTITASYGGKTDTFDVTVSVEPLLPAEYQQVEYIKSTGTQHIITDYKFNNTKPNGYVVNADFTFDAWNNTYATNIAISLGGSSSGLWIGYLNGSQKIGMGTNAGMYYDTGTVTDRHTYTYSSDGVDGTWTRDDGATISRTLTQANSFFTLFYYMIPSGTQNDFHFVGKLYSCTLSKDGAMILDLIPCYRKSDGEIGLYDIVNDKFYTNDGTGTFLKGSDVA